MGTKVPLQGQGDKPMVNQVSNYIAKGDHSDNSNIHVRRRTIKHNETEISTNYLIWIKLVLQAFNKSSGGNMPLSAHLGPEKWIGCLCLQAKLIKLLLTDHLIIVNRSENLSLPRKSDSSQTIKPSWLVVKRIFGVMTS